MKVNEVILSELRQNAKELNYQYHEIIREYIHELYEVETVEEVLAAKRTLLRDMAWYLPLRSEHCYFCVLHGNEDEEVVDCNNCEYGMVHGKCDNGNSQWYKINTMWTQLRRQLNDYYGGEDYED